MGPGANRAFRGRGAGWHAIAEANRILGMEHELAAGRADVAGGDRDFAVELIRLVGLAFGDALDLRGMQAAELPAALALPLGAQLRGPGQRLGKGGRELRITLGLAPDIADRPAQAGARGNLSCRRWRFHCLAWA